ncbi:MAG: hypothetical protein M1410_03415 [Candidatus Thermoplasmatota archaeon]|jgi:hypothetical protein|nr:hypothetical protein [Candidatus Thermoplasmatota archaeon]
MSTGRCANCKDFTECPVCGSTITGFSHVGVRGIPISRSSIWHHAVPCGHRVRIQTEKTKQGGVAGIAVYNGGPLWKDGYQWFNIFWGTFWNGQSLVARIDKAARDIETDRSYSGQLSQYNVGVGSVAGYSVMAEDPGNSVSESDVAGAISNWIVRGSIPDLQGRGAYNIFLPPATIATLGGDQSCSTFCDYHDSANGNAGPFFTCEPFPCSSGCNQCTQEQFDTLTQGLSEEMTELKTDMNPGTGWVIGNEEICDYCDQRFVCNRISTGEYVNAWYSNQTGSCWKP